MSGSNLQVKKEQLMRRMLLKKYPNHRIPLFQQSFLSYQISIWLQQLDKKIVYTQQLCFSFINMYELQENHVEMKILICLSGRSEVLDFKQALGMLVWLPHLAPRFLDHLFLRNTLCLAIESFPFVAISKHQGMYYPKERRNRITRLCSIL